MLRDLAVRGWGIFRYYLRRIKVKLFGENSAIQVEDLPSGRMRDVEISGVTVLLANVGGKFYAVNNVCTHRQCPLSAGDLSGTTITCACHGSQFDVTTGKVLRGPAITDVAAYRVGIANGSVIIDAGSSA